MFQVKNKFWVYCFNSLLLFVRDPIGPPNSHLQLDSFFVIVCDTIGPPNSPPFTSTASLKSHCSICPLSVQVGQLQPVLLTFCFLEFLRQFQIQFLTTDQESAT
jgi:hypothetical protein